MATNTHPIDKRCAWRALPKVAVVVVSVPAGALHRAGVGARREYGAARDGRLSDRPPAPAGHGVVRHMSARWAASRVAQQLTCVVAAGEGPSADAHAHVNASSVFRVVHGLAAAHTTAVSLARKLCCADVVAEDTIGALCLRAGDGLPC